jgi:hypothetical protein
MPLPQQSTFQAPNKRSIHMTFITTNYWLHLMEFEDEIVQKNRFREDPGTGDVPLRRSLQPPMI